MKESDGRADWHTMGYSVDENVLKDMREHEEETLSTVECRAYNTRVRAMMKMTENER